MAGGGSEKWPDDVSFKDEGGSHRYCRLHLTISDMKVKKHMFSKDEVTNGDIKVQIEPSFVDVKVTVTPSGGEQKVYLYHKDTPGDINPKKSGHELQEGGVQLQLWKAKAEDWTRHHDYFISKNK